MIRISTMTLGCDAWKIILHVPRDMYTDEDLVAAFGGSWKNLVYIILEKILLPLIFKNLKKNSEDNCRLNNFKISENNEQLKSIEITTHTYILSCNLCFTLVSLIFIVF